MRAIIQRIFSPPESTLVFLKISSPANNIFPRNPLRKFSVVSCEYCPSQSISDKSQSKKIKDNPLLASKAEKEIGRALFSDESLDVLRFEDSLLAFPSHLLPDLFQIKSNLRIIHAGVKIGEMKQKDFLPAHELALSTILNRTVFPEIDLTLEESITYLKRDDIAAPSVNRGWNLITYRNIPLGWVKNVGNRYNSAFPKEWRIRMSVTEFKDERLKEEMTKFPL